jgi:hypothetical protein
MPLNDDCSGKFSKSSSFVEGTINQVFRGQPLRNAEAIRRSLAQFYQSHSHTKFDTRASCVRACMRACLRSCVRACMYVVDRLHAAAPSKTRMFI